MTLAPNILKLCDFFGMPPNKVNPLLLRIALQYGDDLECLEWMRGKYKLELLPRWCGGYDLSSPPECSYQIPLTGPISTELLYHWLGWIITELSGKWNLNPKGFAFSDSKDAVYFKLRWS